MSLKSFIYEQLGSTEAVVTRIDRLVEASLLRLGNIGITISLETSTVNLVITLIPGLLNHN